MVAEYDPWACYYDLVHPGLPGETEFYAGLAVPARLDTLELGCGTGRVAIPLAMSGVSLVGIDLSRNMLERCAEKLRRVGPVSGELRLVVADMRAFALARRFPLVIMPYRTFMHLLTLQDQVRCLECVREHLAADGRFVLNLWAARQSAIPEAAGPQTDGALEFVGEYDVGEGVRLVHFHAANYDLRRRRIAEVHRFEEHAPSGRILDTADLALERAWLTPRDMARLVRRCGFAPIDVLGDFEGTPLQTDSTEMIWVLQRR